MKFEVNLKELMQQGVKFICSQKVLPLTVNFGHPASAIGMIDVSDLEKAQGTIEESVEGGMLMKAMREGTMQVTIGGKVTKQREENGVKVIEEFDLQQVSFIPSNHNTVAGNMNK